MVVGFESPAIRKMVQNIKNYTVGENKESSLTVMPELFQVEDFGFSASSES